MKIKKLKSPNNIGVYCFYCKENQKLYIGSSICLKHRISQHKAMLRGNYHHNNYLQHAWNKYGENAFKIFIIENCEADDAPKREKLFIKNLNTLIPNGFNISEDTIAPMLGLKHTKETKEKLSKRNSGSNNPMFGKNRSKEEKEKISAARKLAVTDTHRKLLSELASLKTGEKNSFFGKKHSVETLKKQTLVKKLLTEEQTKLVIKLLESGETQLNIAKKFNVGRHVITYINKTRYKYGD